MSQLWLAYGTVFIAVYKHIVALTSRINYKLPQHLNISAYYIVAYPAWLSSVFFSFIDTWIFIFTTNFYVCADVRCLTLYAQVHKYEGKRGAEGPLQILKGFFSYTYLELIQLLDMKKSHACSIISLFCNFRWYHGACVMLPHRCPDQHRRQGHPEVHPI